MFLKHYFVKGSVLACARDRRATLRLGEGDLLLSLRECLRHFFFPTLYNFENIGGPKAPPDPPAPLHLEQEKAYVLTCLHLCN